MKLERILEVEPAYDLLDVGCGLGSVTLRFVLSDGSRAVQLVIATGMLLPENKDVQTEWGANYPIAFDRGYHSPEPMYDGQEAISHDCKWVSGGKCYYDGSTLSAEPYLDVLLREGSDGVWRELEKYFAQRFEEVAP